MSIGAVSNQFNTTPATSGSTGAASGLASQGLGKQDFLMLLVDQLKNQDPLQPMDNTQFIAQLAQFNTLEQMQNMNQTLSSMAQLSMLGEAANFIGKYVTASDPSSQQPLQGTVSGVQIVDGSPVLLVGGNQIKLSDVQTIGSAPATGTSSGSATAGA